MTDTSLGGTWGRKRLVNVKALRTNDVLLGACECAAYHWGVDMRYRLSLLAAAVAAVSSLPAAAAELPAIKISDKNRVPNCATPGRLMAYLQTRNGAMDGRFDAIATEYMRHGEQLRLRWDYAFFQMLVETGNLTFTGDVRPAQNNFAGLGATGKGEPGERFESVSKGVRAHLEHVLMYSGEPIAEPVAERTRKVQEWGILASWQKSIKGPMTYAHLTRKWSPGDRGYARDIAAIADKFFQTTCKQADPRPELVAEARKGLAVSVDTAAAIAPPAARPDGKPTGADIAGLLDRVNRKFERHAAGLQDHQRGRRYAGGRRRGGGPASSRLVSRRRSHPDGRPVGRRGRGQRGQGEPAQDRQVPCVDRELRRPEVRHHQGRRR